VPAVTSSSISSSVSSDDESSPPRSIDSMLPVILAIDNFFSLTQGGCE
jgi:hypothetical protein